MKAIAKRIQHHRLDIEILRVAGAALGHRAIGADVAGTDGEGRTFSAADGPPIARISAAGIESAVIAQVRRLLRQPEVVMGAWRAARASAPDMTEDEAWLALERLDPLWEELFPA